MDKSRLKRNWRVVYWYERDMQHHPQRRYRRAELTRHRGVRGKMTADSAWALYAFLRRQTHIDRVELWRGTQMVIHRTR